MRAADLPSRRSGGSMTPESCRWCEQPQRGHGQRYTAGIGWHPYAPPPVEVIAERMRAKYGLDDEYHVAGVYCGESSHCTEPYPGALPGTPYGPIGIATPLTLNERSET